MYYSLVVIILFSTGLYKSVFSTYFFGKLSFRSSVFWFFMFLYLWSLAFIFMFYVLNSMSFLIMPDVITLFIYFYQFIQDLIYKLGWLFTKSLVFHRFKSCLEKHFFFGVPKFKMSGTACHNFENETNLKCPNKRLLIN